MSDRAPFDQPLPIGPLRFWLKLGFISFDAPAAALLTFDGAYAFLPYVEQGAVQHNGWRALARPSPAL